jgi:hypothetical protein
MSEGRNWFAAKRYGYGTGLPISWQGWVLFIGYLLVFLVSGIFLAPHSVLAYLALVLTMTFAFVWIAKKTTRGGWRSRWGEDE